MAKLEFIIPLTENSLEKQFSFTYIARRKLNNEFNKGNIDEKDHADKSIAISKKFNLLFDQLSLNKVDLDTGFKLTEAPS